MKTFLNLFNPLEIYEDDTEELSVLASLYDYLELSELPISCIGIILFFFFVLDINNPDEEDEDEEITHKYNYFMLGYGTFGTVSVLYENMTGAVPYSFALSTNLTANMFAALLGMLTLWIDLIERFKCDFFGHFLPNGAPTVIAPFIILIELISNASRIISLSVRVFANMTAGHALVEIILKFSFAFALLKFPLTIFFFLPIFVVAVIILLELLVMYLQAYVYGVLMSIYTEELS